MRLFHASNAWPAYGAVRDPRVMQLIHARLPRDNGSLASRQMGDGGNSNEVKLLFLGELIPWELSHSLLISFLSPKKSQRYSPPSNCVCVSQPPSRERVLARKSYGTTKSLTAFADEPQQLMIWLISLCCPPTLEPAGNCFILAGAMQVALPTHNIKAAVRS